MLVTLKPVDATSRTRRTSLDDATIRIDHALANLRKQHLWGDLSDYEYREERRTLERQLRRLARPYRQPIEAVDLDRAAAFLDDLPSV